MIRVRDSVLSQYVDYNQVNIIPLLNALTFCHLQTIKVLQIIPQNVVNVVSFCSDFMLISFHCRCFLF